MRVSLASERTGSEARPATCKQTSGTFPPGGGGEGGRGFCRDAKGFESRCQKESRLLPSHLRKFPSNGTFMEFEAD